MGSLSGALHLNRPHVVAEGLVVLGKALTLNEQGALGQKCWLWAPYEQCIIVCIS